MKEYKTKPHLISIRLWMGSEELNQPASEANSRKRQSFAYIPHDK